MIHIMYEASAGVSHTGQLIGSVHMEKNSRTW